jgi:hypothetical protein
MENAVRSLFAGMSRSSPGFIYNRSPFQTLVAVVSRANRNLVGGGAYLSNLVFLLILRLIPRPEVLTL